MGDDKDTGTAKPDAKQDGGKEAPKEGAKPEAKPDAKPEAQPPEVPPWLPLPKDFADFLECKRESISLAGDGLKTGVDGVTAGFAEAKKKGHFKVTIKGLKDKVPIELADPLELDASVDKDGKLHIHVRDRKDIPQPIKDGIRDFVNEWNRFVNGKSKKLAPPETKEGKLVLAKVATTSALPDGKGFLPHVPAWEKVGAGVLVLASVGFGVGFVNWGDATTTVTDSGGSAAVGDKTSFLEPVAMVTVTPPGRPPVAADFTVSAGILEVNGPLFVMAPHTFSLLNKAGNPLDSLTLQVPRDEGTVTGSTDRGGTYRCRVSHRGGPGGSPSGGECTVRPPSEPLVPPAGPGSTDDVARTTEETEGKPWSLLAIPGVLLGAAGGLVLDEERRRRRENGEQIGQDADDGIGPPPTKEELKAIRDAKGAEAQLDRDHALADLLDKIKDVNLLKGVTNCSYCALAAESCFAGRPVSAKKETNEPTPIAWWRDVARERFRHELGRYTSIQDVTKVMDIWGPGARGILVMVRPTKRGHVINVVNVGGHIIYVDAQTGKECTKFGTPADGDDRYVDFYLVRTN